jgi:DNA-binding XRE family transcriptional regulator
MSGHKKWSTLRDHLQADPVRDERYQSIRRAMFDAVRLGELRETREKTQVQVAETAGTTETNISRLESEADLYVATL